MEFAAAAATPPAAVAMAAAAAAPAASVRLALKRLNETQTPGIKQMTRPGIFRLA